MSRKKLSKLGPFDSEANVVLYGPDIDPNLPMWHLSWAGNWKVQPSIAISSV